MSETRRTLAYRYGAKPPRDWTEYHEAVLRTRDRLWNDLVAIAREHERTLADLYRTHGIGAVRDAEAECERWTETLEVHLAERRRHGRGEAPPEIGECIEARKQARKRYWQAVQASLDLPVPVPAPWVRIAEIRAEKKQLRKEKRLTRRLSLDSTAEVRALLASDDAERTETLTLRDARGVLTARRDLRLADCAAGKRRSYPLLRDGDYNDVLRSLRAALGTGKLRQKDAEDDAHGSLHVQFQGGVSWGQLAAGKKGWRLEPTRLPRTRRTWMMLHGVISTTGTTVRLPVRIHRPLPANARIQELRIVRSRRPGSYPPWYDWHVVFGFRADQGAIRSGQPGKGVLALGLGWRVTPDGLRIGEAAHEDGRALRLVLAPEREERWRDLHELQGAIDRARDAVQRILLQWAAEHSCNAGLRARIDIATSGRSLGPLLDLARDWPLQDPMRRILRDWSEGIVERGPALHRAMLDARVGPACWDDQVRALGVRAAIRRLGSARRKVIGERRDLYCQVARRIVREADTIVLGTLPVARFVARDDAGQREQHPQQVRRQRYAAPAELTRQIRWQAEKHGVTVLDADPAWLSRTCPVHEERMAGGAPDLWQTCPRCGEWDRDRAYALGLLRRGVPAAFERLVEHAGHEDLSRPEIVHVVEEIERELPPGGRYGARWRRVARRALADEPDS